jgi:hypothetical protein
MGMKILQNLQMTSFRRTFTCVHVIGTSVFMEILYYGQVTSPRCVMKCEFVPGTTISVKPEKDSEISDRTDVVHHI